MTRKDKIRNEHIGGHKVDRFGQKIRQSRAMRYIRMRIMWAVLRMQLPGKRKHEDKRGGN